MAVMRIDFIRDFTFLTSLILLLQFSVILQTSHLYVYLPQTLCKMSVLLPEIELDNSRRLRISAQMVDTGEKMTPKKQILIFLSWLCLSIQGMVDEWQHPDDGVEEEHGEGEEEKQVVKEGDGVRVDLRVRHNIIAIGGSDD